jgi:hypothetical protein
MEWTCSECGSSVVADDVRYVESIGWRITDEVSGVCSPCQHKRYDIRTGRAMRPQLIDARPETEMQPPSATELRRTSRSW